MVRNRQMLISHSTISLAYQGNLRALANDYADTQV